MSASTDSKLILIAEDDLVTMKLLSNVVQSMGFVPIKCSNGKRAWETLSDNPEICLLFTDICMPELDGRDLIRMVRGNSKFDNLPIIISSGVVTLEEVHDLLSLGASRFMGKPVDVAELKIYLSALIETISDHIVSENGAI